MIRRALTRHALLLAVALLSAAPTRAAAHTGGPDDKADQHELKGWRLTLSAEANLGQIQQQTFLGLTSQLIGRLELPQLGASLLSESSPSRRTQLEVALQAPLRVALQATPEQPAGRLRRQDWDTPQDAARVMRQLRYGAPGSPLYARLGELRGVTIGHGAAVSDFFNTVNPDLARLGAQASSTTRVYDGEVMIDDVTSPRVVATSQRVRPFALGSTPRPLLSRLSLGAQLAADLSAPLELKRGADGAATVDAARRPTVTSSRATALFGPSVQVWLLQRGALTAMMFGHLLWHDRLGRGEHGGASAQWEPGRALHVQLEVSAIAAHERYVPHYISPLYAVERYQAEGLGAELPATKLRLVEALTPRDDRYLSAALTLHSPALKSSLKARYLSAALTPEAGALTATLVSAPIERASLSGFYHRNFADSLAGALTTQQSLIGAEARWLIWGPFYAAGRYARAFRLRDDGLWTGLDDWQLGLGAQVAFRAVGAR